MSYLGSPPQFAQFPSKFFDGDGSAMTVTLDYAPPNNAALLVFISGVRQDTSAYTLSGTSLTFTGTVPSGTDNVQVVHLGQLAEIPTPGDDTVSTAKIQDDAVTLVKLEDGTQGDILYYGASGAPARLGFGTSGDFLKTQGTGANPVWATVSTVPASDSIINAQIKSDAAIAQSKLANVAMFTRAGTAPVGPTTGDTWYDTSTESMKVWDSTAWSFMGGLTSFTGGTYTTYTHSAVDYGLRTFTSSGTFSIIGAETSIDFLVIAGGGAGGYDNGGGGGAGGVVWTAASSTLPGSYAVTVGAGGAAGSNPGGSGSNSVFSTATAVGGGGGGAGGMNGADGGSGGGGSRSYVGGNTTQGASGGTAFANRASSSTNSSFEGGGGGGAGAQGTAGTSGNLGSGGIGVSTFVNSSATETTAFLLAAVAGTDSSNVATSGSSTGTLYIAGGGAGGSQNSATAATTAAGGGAASVAHTNATGIAGLVNTGSGGGSSGTGGGTGGIGGSGIVIVRWVI